jgi:hypothetical protein
MYSSVLGRFLSADTLVPSVSDPQQLNRYAYALNSPLNYIDPSGHAADAGGAMCGSACWEAAYQNYLKYQQLADAAGDAYHGFLKEYDLAQAAAYYNLSQQVPVQTLITSEGYVATTHDRLVVNGYYGQEAAVSAAADLGAPSAALSFSLVGGVAPNMGESVPAGERLAYTETSWDMSARVAQVQEDASAAIKVTSESIAHTMARHQIGGRSTANKSVFSMDVDILELIRSASNTAAQPQSGRPNFQRVVNAGSTVGIDFNTGRPTSIFTVITDPEGNLVTMFPGYPGRYR